MPGKNIAKPFCFPFPGKCLMVCVLLFLSLCLTAQFTVTIQLKSVPPSHGGDPIFIAGNFNGWNPADQKFSLKNDSFVAELKDLKAGRYEFKFTRGSWDNVECTATGKGVDNHSVQINSDTTIVYSIDGWIDDFLSAAKLHTASANVHIIDTAFEIPQLKKHRRIWMYLPAGYKTGRKHYPVMYMHDGQNVFDNYTSGYGEWGVDECLDSLIAKGKPASIVVGIDNGGLSRTSEYNPFEFTWKDSFSSRTFAPEGDAYLGFIIHTLKPYIDKHYRTLTAKENTIIAGSSMGGLISYYAVLKYPETFGKAGIFSPSFWAANSIDMLTDSLAYRLKGKYFFYIGGKEGESYIDDMVRIQEKVGKNSGAMIYSFIDPVAEHNEQAWRKWFAEFYNWIMADGYNVSSRREH